MLALRVIVVFVLWHLGCFLEKLQWRSQFVRQFRRKISDFTFWVRMTDLEWCTGPENVGPLHHYYETWKARHKRSMPIVERNRRLRRFLPFFAVMATLAFSLGRKMLTIDPMVGLKGKTS